jgi:hypothetical protein
VSLQSQLPNFLPDIISVNQNGLRDYLEVWLAENLLELKLVPWVDVVLVVAQGLRQGNQVHWINKMLFPDFFKLRDETQAVQDQLPDQFRFFTLVLYYLCLVYYFQWYFTLGIYLLREFLLGGSI